jgi:succinate dehydrogenase / fumarate reductase flavoprotein subunit
MTENIERHIYDVVVIGAGGAGLRAAIEARLAGKKTAIISKSLFGKAHTVMAEGGAAAAMGNVNPRDNWMVHFRDTMRGGKFLNNVRMAELHAKEAPDRVWELETYGALFDRTKDGKISQRNFGGHEYPRLAHVGDRTGLELIRTLQQKIVSLQQEDLTASGDYEARIRVFAECTITDLLLDRRGGGPARIAGAFGYYRESGRFVLFEAPTVILATGGVGKSYKVTSNSWEYTGDGHALALRAGATLINMEFLQFHPTGMVWPPSVKGILVTESVRGDGGVLRNTEGKRFMFNYVPEVFRQQYADTEAEADRWYTDPDHNRRPPELLPRDEVARAINAEVKAGRGTDAGGVLLDVSTRMPAETIRRRLPSMYHQFKELADVDITKQPMEVGPTCHYVMGGVEVDADTAATPGVAGLFAVGEVSGGMHGSNRLGGNSLSDLLVFGKRAGEHAAAYVDGLGASRPTVDRSDVDAAVRTALAPLERPRGDNPYEVWHELQQVMQDLVGIIRRKHELEESLKRLADVRERVANLSATGGRQYNPGWHLALDLRNMLVVSECTARAALQREESRGGHTREDFPAMDPVWRQVNLVCSIERNEVTLRSQPIPMMRPELLALFDRTEMSKYLTDEELASYDRVADGEPVGAAGTEEPAEGKGN